MTLRCACVTTLPSIHNVGCLSPLNLALEGHHSTANIITCEIVDAQAKSSTPKKSSIMPWRQPENPGRVFKDEGEEHEFWESNIYKLPFRKFQGLDEATVWGPLYQHFNTAPMPILDMDAWHADVVELMRASATTEELYTQMEKRKQQRFEELTTAIDQMQGGAGWISVPRHQQVKKLGSALTWLVNKPSMYQVVHVFQAMSEIKQEEKLVVERG